MYKALILLCLVAVALGGFTGPDHDANRARERHVNYHNGVRQHHVNAIAEHVGAGTGTARYNGVPGTPVGANAYGHGAYGGYGGYGYGHGYGHGYGGRLGGYGGYGYGGNGGYHGGYPGGYGYGHGYH